MPELLGIQIQITFHIYNDQKSGYIYVCMYVSIFYNIFFQKFNLFHVKHVFLQLEGINLT